MHITEILAFIVIISTVFWPIRCREWLTTVLSFKDIEVVNLIVFKNFSLFEIVQEFVKMYYNITWLHWELYFEGSFLIVTQKRLTSNGRVGFYASRRVWRETLPCVISLMVIVLLRASLSVHILWLNIHSCRAYRASFLIKIRDHTGIVLAYWGSHLIEVSLSRPVGRRLDLKWVRSICLSFEIELSSHVFSAINWIVDLEML